VNRGQITDDSGKMTDDRAQMIEIGMGIEIKRSGAAKSVDFPLSSFIQLRVTGKRGIGRKAWGRG